MANELEKQTWELERQTGAINEMTGQIKDTGTAIVASQAALARTYQQELSGVSRELGQMTSAFSFGLNRVSNGLNVMAHSLNFMSDAICKRLDALHNIANNPLLTQTQELYRRALVNYNKGFFEEALEDVKQAIERYKTDYMSWFLMGHIFAFGEGEFSNVKDLEQAINAFTQAAKYNSPNVAASQDARLLAAEIYFYWGTAQYLQSNILSQTGKKEDATEMLARAQASFEKSFQFSDKMHEALCNSARCKVIQNQKNAAIADLENLFLRDRNYCISVKNDTDFTGIENEIDALIMRLRHKVFIVAEPKYKKIQSLIAELDNIKGFYGNRSRIPAQFTEDLPYFDIMDYDVKFEGFIPQIETAIEIQNKSIFEAKQREEQRQLKAKQAEEQRQLEAKWAEEQRQAQAEKEARHKRNIIVGVIIGAIVGGIAGGIIGAIGVSTIIGAIIACAIVGYIIWSIITYDWNIIENLMAIIIGAIVGGIGGCTLKEGVGDEYINIVCIIGGIIGIIAGGIFGGIKGSDG
ncbi:MAG: hypothetical protein LBH43_12335 [Treponema sp.]|jgi:tetratricopeptide (TPR) repeat protein|nr:hypothetical protein [Treponema sp.]